MKVAYPKKKKKSGIQIHSAWIFLFVFVLIIVAFTGGMFFYRGGYATDFLAEARDGIEIEALSEVENELNTELNLYQSNGLPTIFLDIPFDSMMQIEEKREEALDVGILLSSDDDYVSANMHFNDEQNLDIKMRLKGDWTDHLESDKWSYRVHITEDDGAVLGMRRFSLQAPETRNYTSEWGYHQNLFLENILTTRYHFVNVVINGEHKGIYALEESFTEDLLESQERREGVIIRIDEDLLWSDRARYINSDPFIWYTHEDEGSFWLVDGALNNEITPFRGNHINGDDILSEELASASELLYSYNRGELSADQILDEELWGKYYAITDLWAAGHSTVWHNQRFYYNPVTGLLEPVAFDGLALPQKYKDNKLAHLFELEPFFNTPGVQKAYIETLERVTTPEYIAMLRKEFGDELGNYYELLIEEYENKTLSDNLHAELQLPWDSLTLRSDFFTRHLNPDQPIRGNYHWVEKNGETFIQLDLVNMMIVPVELGELIIGDTAQDFEKEWCADEFCQAELVENIDEAVLLPSKENDFEPVTFLVPTEISAEALSTEKLSLKVKLYGGSETFEVPIFSNYVPQGIDIGVKPTATLAEALAEHPFLIHLDDKDLAIQQGDWSVSADLVLPVGYNLFIPEGTSLKFEEDSVFLVHGSVEIKGTEENPVFLTSQAESWGGMVVLEASEPSNWQYVIAEKMAGISRDGWILTGGITFYESEINIANSVIGNNNTEDALNIILSPFSFEYVEFLNTPSDAFDGDFTTGTASYCSFHDIGGDAFDVSGTEATITDTHFLNIADKAISAGEKSNLTLQNISITNVGIGVASKDLSIVLADALRIDTAKVVGLATYIKKPQYGPGTIIATAVEFMNTERPTLNQTHNKMLVNGEKIPQEDIDVDALYNTEK